MSIQEAKKDLKRMTKELKLMPGDQIARHIFFMSEIASHHGLHLSSFLDPNNAPYLKVNDSWQD